MDEMKIIRSKRRTIAIEINGDLQVLVRAPLWMRNSEIRQFVERKRPWIEKHLKLAQARNEQAQPPFTEDEIRKLTDMASADLPRRVEKYAPAVGVTVGRITIRHQRTRWGSCSVKGNLNLNCLLMLCPETVRDYVVVHELCHRREMNHGPTFWAQVAKILPDYMEPCKWLAENGGQIIRRIRK